MKNPLTPTGIETSTFRFVAQQNKNSNDKKSFYTFPMQFFKISLLVLQNSDSDRVQHKHCVSITCTFCKERNPSGLESVLADTSQVAFPSAVIKSMSCLISPKQTAPGAPICRSLGDEVTAQSLRIADHL